jgi:choline dehydrogenase-like flavoprotein
MAEYQSYDLIVAGGGTAGCQIASRIAENGIHPKTGDRLRVALIEGGPYFIQGKEAPRPGYGVPSRRRAVVNINYQEFEPEPWPFDGSQNKMVGGCGLHWGGNGYLPLSEDYDHWRRETGVDWTQEKFKTAVDEIKEVYNIHPSVLENMTRGNNLFRDAARAMGYQPERVTMARRNCVNCGYCGSGHLCKYDSKGSSLYYIHLAEQNGVKIIPNAEVEQIIIEKQGGRPLAKGVYYTQYGQRKEARTPKVIVTCGTVGTPVLLMRSGYGPREVLGNRLLVENSNVGRHLDGDMGHNIDALFDLDIKHSYGGVERYDFILSRGDLGYQNLRVRDSKMSAIDEAYPHILALHKFSPEFGWEHKEYMRSIGRRLGSINVAVGAAIWDKGVVTPGGKHVYNRQHPGILKSLKEGTEFVVEMYNKMAVRPIKVDPRPAERFRIAHQTSTCRAGDSPKNSVVNSDFECHDIDNLFVSSGAVIPRGNLTLAHIPVCVVAAYSWRRIVENHFSRGT